MSEIILTSDLHYDHLKVAEERGFASVEEHHEWIADNWCSNVHPKSNVIVAGDLTLGNPARVLEFLGKLPGIKDLVSGNHDQCHACVRGSRSKQAQYFTAFRSVNEFTRLKAEGRDILVSHFPYGGDHTETDRHSQYRLRDEGKWLLHGHVHTEWKINGRQINVGLDAWGAPVAFTDLVKIIDATEAH